jgi:hypothetical protein
MPYGKEVQDSLRPGVALSDFPSLTSVEISLLVTLGSFPNGEFILSL